MILWWFSFLKINFLENEVTFRFEESLFEKDKDNQIFERDDRVSFAKKIRD